MALESTACTVTALIRDPRQQAALGISVGQGNGTPDNVAFNYKASSFLIQRPPLTPGGPTLTSVTCTGAQARLKGAISRVASGTLFHVRDAVTITLTTGRGTVSAQVVITRKGKTVLASRQTVPSPPNFVHANAGATPQQTPSLAQHPTNTPTPASQRGPSTAGSTFYFAEGYTGGTADGASANFGETLNVVNPNSGTAGVRFTYWIEPFPGSTMVVGRVINRTLGPLSALRESVNSDVGSNKRVSVEVTSQQNIVVTRTITRTAANGTILNATTTTGIAPRKNYSFPGDYLSPYTECYITIFNPNQDQADVRLVTAPQPGSSAMLQTIQITVPGFSRVTVPFRADVLSHAGGADPQVGAFLSSNQPVVAEQVMYFGSGIASDKTGSIISTGASSLGTDLRIAYGASILQLELWYPERGSSYCQLQDSFA